MGGSVWVCGSEVGEVGVGGVVDVVDVVNVMGIDDEEGADASWER